VNALLFPLPPLKTANKGNGLQSRAEPLAKITSHKKQVSFALFIRSGERERERERESTI